MPFNILKSKNAKIHALPSDNNTEDEKDTTDLLGFRMRAVRLSTLFKRYGGSRYPRIESFEVFEENKELILWRFVPHGATVIYISHEWAGIDHPDPHGDQMYHLLLLLERLQRGDVERTDMDAFHSLLYKHNYMTTAEEWKRKLDPEKTFIFYDGFCVSKVVDALRSKIIHQE